jgi:hypothetical protein
MHRSIGLIYVLLGSATAFADDATPAAWSDAVVERPLTLPAGKMAIYGDLDVVRFNFDNQITLTSELIHGGVGYGVNDQLTIGVDYAFNLHSSTSFTNNGMTMSSGDSFPANGRGPLLPYLSLRLLHGPLSVAASGGLVINLAGRATVDANGTSFDATYSIIAGAVVKYNLSPSVAVYTGAPFAGSGIAFAGSPFGPGPVGNQLQIGLSSTSSGNSGASTLTLPVGVGGQLSPQFFAFAQTTLLGAYIANKPSGADNPAFIGSDAKKGGLGIPLTVGAFASLSHELEIGGTLSFPDLQNASELYLFGIAARLYSN